MPFNSALLPADSTVLTALLTSIAYFLYLLLLSTVLLMTVHWFYTHRVVTVFSSMNIFMEASLDLAVPTKDSLLDPRGKKA